MKGASREDTYLTMVSSLTADLITHWYPAHIYACPRHHATTCGAAEVGAQPARKFTQFAILRVTVGIARVTLAVTSVEYITTAVKNSFRFVLDNEVSFISTTSDISSLDNGFLQQQRFIIHNNLLELYRRHYHKKHQCSTPQDVKTSVLLHLLICSCKVSVMQGEWGAPHFSWGEDYISRACTHMSTHMCLPTCLPTCLAPFSTMNWKDLAVSKLPAPSMKTTCPGFTTKSFLRVRELKPASNPWSVLTAVEKIQVNN